MPSRILRSIVSWDLVDSGFSRDAIQVTPWFHDTGLGNPDALASDLVDVFTKATTGWAQAGYQTTCKLYEFKGEAVPTGPPVASVTKYPGSQKSSTNPRDIALCLSYYAGSNVKRRRGRLYLPMNFRGVIGAPQPAVVDVNAALAVATGLGAAGGTEMEWVVYSHVDSEAHNVTTAYVDNEYDTQRRRGLRPTTRTAIAVTA